MIKTYSIHKDVLIARFAVELPAMFIKSSRVQTLAALLALDALFVEWCSVNCHERLKKSTSYFCHINNIVHASAGYTDIEHAGHLGAAGGAVQPMVCCVDDDTSNKSEIEDSGVKTEDQSVLVEAPGEKAGLGGGQHVL